MKYEKYYKIKIGSKIIFYLFDIIYIFLIFPDQYIQMACSLR